MLGDILLTFILAGLIVALFVAGAWIVARVRDAIHLYRDIRSAWERLERREREEEDPADFWKHGRPAAEE